MKEKFINNEVQQNDEWGWYKRMLEFEKFVERVLQKEKIICTECGTEFYENFLENPLILPMAEWCPECRRKNNV